MTPDLWTLVATVVLALAQIGLASTVAKRQTGIPWSVGPRDNPIVLAGLAGRLERAQVNLYESLPLFAILLLVAHVAGHANDITFIGAQVYFWARVLYVPAYASGLPWVRTTIWQVGMIGLIIIATQLF